MGNFSSFISNRLSTRREIRVLIEGTSAAGKTSVLHKQKFGDASNAPGTNIHPQVETVNHNGIDFTFFDVSCATRERYRPSWREHFENIQVVVFVIDSTDKGKCWDPAGFTKLPESDE